MGRNPQEFEICQLILDELSDIKEKKGVSFNKLFNKIKKRRGKFSYDTLSKYLTKMENDGRIIRIIDINSNKKIKPTLLYKNLEIISLQNEKNNIYKILMDKNTKFYSFSKKGLRDSDLFPKFKEILMKFLENQMKINVNHFMNEEILSLDILLENFNLFLVENPEINGTVKNINDIVLLFYLNLLESIINSDLINMTEIHYNLFFHINFSKLFVTLLFRLVDKIQKDHIPFTNLFLKKEKAAKISNYAEDKIMQLLLDQLPGEFKENIKILIQKKKLEEFSEKYKRGLKIF